MAQLKTEPNLPQTDDFYAALLAAHEELSADETHALNARLILVLANHIGDLDVLTAAISVAGGRNAVADPTKA
ncbi:MAG: DUF2783 domain-containing protein [Pseudomonadota bacterium]